VPGWHEKTKDLVADGKLVLLGITQEQHAERCRLFAQWKGFQWPILHDPVNVMRSKAVPLTVAIDELGVVRSTRPTEKWVRETFVKTDYEGSEPTDKAKLPSVEELQEIAEAEDSAGAWRALGDAASIWKPGDTDLAVNAYNSALQRDQESPVTHFRLGVAYRNRHESIHRQQSDFNRAVSHWTAALTMDPNQYIWRRRIQQYGPRLAKPYPFYDWVDKAEAEIVARGDTPIALEVPLSGAEIAKPAKSFDASVRQVSPDPRNLITRDKGRSVAINRVFVPSRVQAGDSVRLHLEFSLASKDVLWNNEGEPLRVWIEGTRSWKPQQQLTVYQGVPGAAESSETRLVEIELQSTAEAKSESIRGFAVFNICEKSTGTCLMRRADFSAHVNVVEGTERLSR